MPTEAWAFTSRTFLARARGQSFDKTGLGPDERRTRYLSFVRSVTMDKWSDEQLKKMKVNLSLYHFQ